MLTEAQDQVDQRLDEQIALRVLGDHQGHGPVRCAALGAVENVPTASEGKELKNFAYKIWSGFMVPKNTPEEMVQKLHKAIGAALKAPGVRTRLTACGLRPPPKKKPLQVIDSQGLLSLAEWTGLEPATPGVTGCKLEKMHQLSATI